MRLTITAVGIDLTDPAREFVEEKVGRLEKLIVPAHQDSALADVKLTYAPSNTTDTEDKCAVTISGLGEKHIIHMEAEAPDMLAAIDHCATKLKEPLRRFEERFRDHITKAATDAKEQARTADAVDADAVDADAAADSADGVDLEGDGPA